MDKIVHYNFLNDIIQKIEDVVEDKKEKERVLGFEPPVRI